jgi:hypothetical protein
MRAQGRKRVELWLTVEQETKVREFVEGLR